MTIAVLISVVLSLAVSTCLCIWIFKRKENKRLAIFFGFLVNSLLLISVAIFFYKLDSQFFHYRAMGLFESLGILAFPFFIPILTCVNFYILQSVRKTTIG
ncbi:hypothetical protein [Alkalihalobacillus sp. LMS39]|uniref:hypothetical protein n=1 Tax=Alkalihalobacillus sp. LMS39 TaxID=2924032 RepID=UPI001FB2321F|nr:hypothetical protein [Alkalihalobacillus sp. LMS39]UOE95602.1 hypothetical protein MM271_08350 [Alkalihalobacillus sp. LMS39]